MQQPRALDWLIFAGLILGLLIVDLFQHRRGHGESRKSAVVWSVVWIAAGVGFSGYVWLRLGAQASQEYLAAYVIEKSLSLDNLFVFLLIFGNLNIPTRRQYKVLLWGIFGALAFRAVFIFVGVAVLQRWEWVVYVFAGVLALAAVQALRKDPSADEESRAVQWLSRHLPISRDADTDEFVVEKEGRKTATPLVLALLAIELTDVVFAIDSVPAALSVTRREFLVYSSNAFAILGLRALYIVLAQTIAEMKYLHYGLAFVLAFAAFKMSAHEWIELSPLLSVAIVLTVLAISVLASLRARRAE